MTIYQMKEEISNLRAEVTQVDNWISDNAAKPETKIADLKAKQDRLTELNDRISAMNGTMERAEAAQRAKLDEQGKTKQQEKKDEPKALHGQFYRAACRVNMDPVQRAKVLNSLGAIPESTTTGANFLPTQLMTALVHEPFDSNPIRFLAQITNITGLEIPKIAYTVDDDDFLNDSATAKELELTGDKISFGRFKTKVMASISDTTLNGSDVDLGAYVDNALQSGLCTKEKKCLFDASPATALAHMSFYSTANAITKVEKDTLLDAILGAYADLPDAFAANAKVVMKRSDYVAMITTLANGSDTLWGRKPEDVIGIPVVFVDRATTPIVGDFSYLGINYDLSSTFDSDKDIKTGDTSFVLTAWFDIQFKLKSAFRLAAKKAVSGT